MGKKKFIEKKEESKSSNKNIYFWNFLKVFKKCLLVCIADPIF
jgi:hypothetical protein